MPSAERAEGAPEGEQALPPRRPWLAFLLTFAAPGLGHLYAGAWRIAVVLLPLTLALVAGAISLLVTAELPAPAVLLLFASFPLLFLVLAWHAARTARAAAGPIARKRPLRWALYAGFALASAALSQVASPWIEGAVHAYRIPSGAMIPTLAIGDHVYADLRAFDERPPRRGDVVVFVLGRRNHELAPIDVEPAWAHETFAQRVVGVPGDRVAFENGDLWLNGSRVPTRAIGESLDRQGARLALFEEALPGHSHRIARRPDLPDRSFEEVVVPEGRYFLLGDNRDDSNDSRYWGTVHGDDLIGPLRYVYGSWMGTRAGLDVRWDRFGMKIE